MTENLFTAKRARTAIAHRHHRSANQSRYLSSLAVAAVLAGWPWFPSAPEAIVVKAPTLSVALPMGPSSTPAEKPSIKAQLTSCQEVLHIGDSTSVGLVSKMLLPEANERLDARYKTVGVQHFYPEISGARSIVEKYQDRPNAKQVAKSQRTKGYRGCWVIALGTNDSANTEGAPKILGARIDAMMKIIGDDPVLWTTTKTLREKGSYQNAHMEIWNKTLIEACARYKNMRIYDWASEVQDGWFSKDGLHFNKTGSKERAARFAQALTQAFPKDSASLSGCLVLSTD